MGFLKDLLSGGTGNLVNTVGTVLDKLTTSKEEKMQLELEMKKADMQYQVDLKKLTLEEQKIMTGEMESARRREVDLSISQYSTKLAKNVAPYLALGTTVLTFSLFTFILIKDVDDKKKEIIFYILGVLSAIVTQIFSYYFGSSMGSANKAQTLDTLLKKE
jgi:hypothetical protein